MEVPYYQVETASLHLSAALPFSPISEGYRWQKQCSTTAPKWIPAFILGNPTSYMRVTIIIQFTIFDGCKRASNQDKKIDHQKVYQKSDKLQFTCLYML